MLGCTGLSLLGHTGLSLSELTTRDTGSMDLGNLFLVPEIRTYMRCVITQQLVCLLLPSLSRSWALICNLLLLSYLFLVSLIYEVEYFILYI